MSPHPRDLLDCITVNEYATNLYITVLSQIPGDLSGRKISFTPHCLSYDYCCPIALDTVSDPNTRFVISNVNVKTS